MKGEKDKKGNDRKEKKKEKKGKMKGKKEKGDPEVGPCLDKKQPLLGCTQKINKGFLKNLYLQN